VPVLSGEFADRRHDAGQFVIAEMGMERQGEDFPAHRGRARTVGRTTSGQRRLPWNGHRVVHQRLDPAGGQMPLQFATAIVSTRPAAADDEQVSSASSGSVMGAGEPRVRAASARRRAVHAGGTAGRAIAACISSSRN
jgi:hypothetical protein